MMQQFLFLSHEWRREVIGRLKIKKLREGKESGRLTNFTGALVCTVPGDRIHITSFFGGGLLSEINAINSKAKG